MPAFFTHETVCEKVLDRLPEKQAARISDRALFYLGAQGGDPLFLYRDKNKRLGVVLHREKIYEFFAALLRADCDSFALGYLTHYAADTVFHPYVYRYVREHGEEYPKHNLHALIERDIDYFLLAAANADPRRHSYPTKPGGDGLKTLYTALSPAIRSVYGISVDYKKFARAYRAYFRYQKLLQDRSGMLRPLVRGAEAVFFAPHTLSDLMLRRTPEILQLPERRRREHRIRFGGGERRQEPEADTAFYRRQRQGRTAPRKALFGILQQGKRKLIRLRRDCPSFFCPRFCSN